MNLNIGDLPKEIQNKIKIENGIPTRKVKITKDEIRGYATAMLNQVKGLSKSDINRVLAHSKKMNEV